MIRPFVRESLCRQVANLNRCCRFCQPRPPGPAMPGPAPVFRRRRPTWPGPGPGIVAILWGIHGEFMGTVLITKMKKHLTFPLWSLWILGVSEFWRTFAWAWKKRLMSTNIHSDHGTEVTSARETLHCSWWATAKAARNVPCHRQRCPWQIS